MTFKPTPKGTNLRLKKNEDIKDPQLTKMKRRGGTAYAVWGHGTGNITLFRIIGKDLYESYKKQGMKEKTYVKSKKSVKKSPKKRRSAKRV